MTPYIWRATAIVSAARRTTVGLGLLVCASALALPLNAAAASPQQVDMPHAGDCALTLRDVPPTTTAGTLQIAIDSHDAQVLFKVAQVQPFVVTLSDPLLEGSKIFVTLNGSPLPDMTVERALDGTKAPDACADPGSTASLYDGRSNFEADAFYGLAVDNFAPAESLEYRNAPSGTIRTRWTAGVQAQYRLFGQQDDVRQVWVSTQILHGLRTSDVNCQTSPDLAVCKATSTEAQKFFAIIEHASTIEAQIEGRVEVLRLQVAEETPVKVFASTRFGFIGLAGAPKVYSSDAYVGGGLVAPKGIFRGSFAEVGWGRSRQFQTAPNANRMKIYGTLFFDVAPGLLEQAKNIFTQSIGSTRFFAAIVVDRNPNGRAPDAVQSYFGVDFDVRRLFGGF
jgi:hypothetical protein